MIIPENLTLEEMIGVLKAESATQLAQSPIPDIQSNIHTVEILNILEVIKRELDGKVDK